VRSFNYKLWDEEIKCLFLRVRNPSNTIFDKFIYKIYGYEAFKEEAKLIRKRTKKTYSDFQNKYNIIVKGLVQEYQDA